MAWGHRLRAGVRLAVDVGSARIGVAHCDADGRLASPLATVPRGAGDLDALADLAPADDAIEVIRGLPLALSGREWPAAAQARTFAPHLAGRVPAAPVPPVDHRFPT